MILRGRKPSCMHIQFYKTNSGKNLIIEFLDSLSIEERAEGYYILEKLERGTVTDLRLLNIKHFVDKIWEIKFRKFNRLFYVLKNKDTIYFLHGCKKQKNATELKDRNLVIKRAKEIK